MPIHRIVFRVDFRVNFELIDSPGRTMSLLDVEEGFWPEFKENQSKHQVLASRKVEGLSQVITVEPTAVHGAAESTAGWGFDGFAERAEPFHQLLGIADSVCRAYAITSFKRVGIRFHYLGSPFATSALACQAFRAMHAEKGLSAIESNLGEISDYGIAVDGQHEDKILYHLRAGPYKAQEASRYFRDFAKELEERDDYTIVCDIDQYEHDVAIPHGLKRWCRPLLLRAGRTVEQLETLLANGSKK